MARALTPEEKESFQRDGFLVLHPQDVEGAHAECQELRQQCSRLINSYEHVDSIARQQVKAASNTDVGFERSHGRYLMLHTLHSNHGLLGCICGIQEPLFDAHYEASAANVSFFLEANAVDECTGQLKVAKHESINTIGHGRYPPRSQLKRSNVRVTATLHTVYRLLHARKRVPTEVPDVCACLRSSNITKCHRLCQHATAMNGNGNHLHSCAALSGRVSASGPCASATLALTCLLTKCLQPCTT